MNVWSFSHHKGQPVEEAALPAAQYSTDAHTNLREIGLEFGLFCTSKVAFQKQLQLHQRSWETLYGTSCERRFEATFQWNVLFSGPIGIETPRGVIFEVSLVFQNSSAEIKNKQTKRKWGKSGHHGTKQTRRDLETAPSRATKLIRTLEAKS